MVHLHYTCNSTADSVYHNSCDFPGFVVFLWIFVFFMQLLKGPAGKVIQLSHSKMEAFSESCADELEMDWQGAFWCSSVEQMQTERAAREEWEGCGGRRRNIRLKKKEGETETILEPKDRCRVDRFARVASLYLSHDWFCLTTYVCLFLHCLD